MSTLQNITGNNIILIGFLTTIMGTIVVQFREYPKKIFDFIVDRYVFKATIYHHDHFYQIVEKWLAVNYPNSYRSISIITKSINSENNDDVKKINIIHEKNKILINKYKKIIICNKDREKMEFSNQSRSGYIDYFEFKGWRAGKQIIQLMNDILKSNIEYKTENEVKIFVNNNWGWAEVNILKVKPLSNIIIDYNIKKLLINDIEEFQSNSKWYDDRGIPYKRTYVLFGDPGNGKTSIALGLAAYFKKNVSYLNINSITNDESLRDILDRIKTDTILLIEDADNLFAERKSNEHKISFSTFINCLDGALYKRGLITIMTTNHIDKLDPALLREGRIDIKINITNPKKELIKEYIEKFYEDDDIIIHKEGLCMSKVQEICLINKNDKQKTIDTINLN